MTSTPRKFYITTAIPYVNAEPHIGHALEFIQADVLARYHRLKGEEVLLLSGADENALKNVQAAEAAGRGVQAFVDANAALFADLARTLDVHLDVFQKGSDQERHYPSSQELWRRCARSGDIYKKSYTGLYCVGCEAFYAPEELTPAGECPEHPGRKVETVAEENYFFRLSRYRDRIVGLIRSGELAVIPESRKNEVLAFLKDPPDDISISRTNERARNWGVPVPDDDTQRIYVWFDALNIYQSGVGFGWDEERYKKWWPADIHLIGKGITRFHAVYWPAFLLSAGLEPPKSVVVHGYLTVNGQKMSKTVGNVIDPFAIARRYGVDPLRYYLLREIPSDGDGDVSEAKLVERYHGDLSNGLGNLVARVAALGAPASPLAFSFSTDIQSKIKGASTETFRVYEAAFSGFKLHEAISSIWQLIGVADRYLNAEKPWANPQRSREVVVNAAYLVSTVANLVRPFLPATADKILEQFRFADGVLEVKRGAVLFPRLG